MLAIRLQRLGRKALPRLARRWPSQQRRQKQAERAGPTGHGLSGCRAAIDRQIELCAIDNLAVLDDRVHELRVVDVPGR